MHYFDKWGLKASIQDISMALKNISIQDISVIVANLSFSALVGPFQKNGVSGRAISRISSYQDILDIFNNQISKVVKSSP